MIYTSNMDLNKKIEQIIVDKGMSPSFFADAIGVQRSSISHILSGRNKPSLDIIQKILRVFPDINRDWLLFDTETPYDNHSTNSIQPAVFQQVTPQVRDSSNARESSKFVVPEERIIQQNLRRKVERPEVPSNPITPPISVAPEPTGKKIERIVIFYTDGTFMESKPM